MDTNQTSLNPYSHYLGTQDPASVIEATPVQLRSLIANADPEQLTFQSAPGKWSIREILCHLADTEIAFGFRLRQAIAQEHHTIQPFDQDHWAKLYHNFSAEEALDAFSAIRKWNLLFLQQIGPDSFRKPVTHPERGTMTVRTIMETMAGHDLNHLQQVVQLLQTSREEGTTKIEGQNR